MNRAFIFARGHALIRTWQAGDAILFKKTGSGLTGIMVSGTALGVPYKNRHWNGKDSGKQYIQVRFDRLTDYTKGQILPVKGQTAVCGQL